MIRSIRLGLFLGFVFAVFGGYWLAGGRAENPQPAEPKASKKSTAQKAKEKEPALAKFMQAKLKASSQILEGLCTEDFDLIQKGAEKLKSMSEAERWRVSNDAIYRQYSRGVSRFRGQYHQSLEGKEKPGLGRVGLDESHAKLHRMPPLGPQRTARRRQQIAGPIGPRGDVMRAMILPRLVSLDEEDRPLELADVRRPEPGAGEVLVRVAACGVCHTELDEIEGRTAPPKLPVILGHEIIGRVERAGPGVTKRKPGERVGVGWIHSSTGAPDENLSPQFQATGRDADGGYAEYLTVPEDYAYPIPEVFSDAEAAPLLCAGAVGYRGSS